MSNRTFRVAARAKAAAIIRQDESLDFSIKLDGRPTRLTFRTNYLDVGQAVKVAGDFWMDGEGEADSPEDAGSRFTTAARDISNMLSFITNAAVEPLEPEVVFETTLGVTRRPFFQRLMPPQTMCFSSRFVDLEAVTSFSELMAGHPERDRITRAMSQYAEALRIWATGSELLLVQNLFIGVEAIKVACWRQVLRRTGKSQRELADEWGYAPGPDATTLPAFLNSVSRRKLVFRDDPVHTRAKRVSDYYEHGLMNAGKLYAPARFALLPTARYLRAAVLDVLDAPEGLRNLMEEGRYATPRGPKGFEQYWRSELVGDAEELAAQGNEYPIFRWQFGMKEIEFDSEADCYRFKPDHKLTACMNETLRFEGGNLEMWDAGTFSPGGAEDDLPDNPA